MKQKLNKLISHALRHNWTLNAFSNYEGEAIKYSDVAQIISFQHDYFEAIGIKPGDKIVLLGRNSSNWAIAYLSIVSYGAVVVPVLPDFTPDDVIYIVNHSESVLMFVSEALLKPLDTTEMKKIKGALSLEDFSVAWEKHGENMAEACKQLKDDKSRKKPTQRSIKLGEFSNSDLVILSYTSGTTGFSKGVMISRNNLVSNIVFAQEHMPLKAGDRICSFLPMAHIYGQLFEFLFPFSTGCHTTFLGKMPSPPLLLKAFGEIKPNLILSVPLIIEKIYNKRIAPALEKKSVKFMLSVPGLKLLVYNKIRKQLSQSFGGEFYEIVIGGAPLNKEVEDFLRKVNFRFTIGYGMTECGPLISYDPWDSTQAYSAGKVVDRMQVRIDSDDPYSVVGEILVKGENVMMGYYKDEKSTKAVLDDDGWLRTGDLGVTDAEGYVYIRGRSKNMILGANGKNIYPEEIENKVASDPLVLENIIVQRENQLICLVFPDPDFMKAESITNEMLPEKLESVRVEINKKLPKFMQIQKMELRDDEFDKTPKKSIKRFKYS